MAPKLNCRFHPLGSRVLINVNMLASEPLTGLNSVGPVCVAHVDWVRIRPISDVAQLPETRRDTSNTPFALRAWEGRGTGFASSPGPLPKYPPCVRLG